MDKSLKKTKDMKRQDKRTLAWLGCQEMFFQPINWAYDRTAQLNWILLTDMDYRKHSGAESLVYCNLDTDNIHDPLLHRKEVIVVGS